MIFLGNTLREIGVVRAYILFFFMFVNMFLGKIFVKRCSNSVSEHSAASQSLFMILNGITACVFFFVTGGFRIAFNRETAIFALLYAVACGVSVLSSLAAYKLSSITGVSIIAGTCSTVTTALVGCLVFEEPVTARKIIRILVLIGACTLVFMNTHKNNKKEDKTEKVAAWREYTRFGVVLLGLVFSGCAATVLSKKFALSETVTDENSFFFLTNVIMVVISSVVFAIRGITDRQEVKESFSLMQPKNMLSILLNTAASNISSLLGIWIVAVVDISVYSPVSQAMGVITAVLASLLFKEKQGKLLVAAAAIACVAVII